MSVSIALYKGKGNWVNSLIRLRSQSEYSHCELLVDGKMYSSTVMDGGVRCKSMTYLNEKEWDIIPIYFLDASTVEQHYISTKDNPYGWTDLFLTQIVGRKDSNHKGDFCLEWCLSALGIKDASSYRMHQVKDLVEWANSLVLK